MEQFDHLGGRAVAVMYARCDRCRYMGRVTCGDEDMDSVFRDAHAHARECHEAASMSGIEIVWDVIPSA